MISMTGNQSYKESVLGSNPIVGLLFVLWAELLLDGTFNLICGSKWDPLHLLLLDGGDGYWRYQKSNFGGNQDP